MAAVSPHLCMKGLGPYSPSILGFPGIQLGSFLGEARECLFFDCETIIARIWGSINLQVCRSLLPRRKLVARPALAGRGLQLKRDQ
jgi:hypothetical protein